MISTDSDFDWQDIPLVLDAYCRARQNYHGRERPETDLTNNVDEWIHLQQRIATLPPPSTTSLTLRRTALGATTYELASLHLSGPQSSWPPSYFGTQEITWFADARIVNSLRGTTPASQQLLERIDNLSSPMKVKRTLCGLVLTYYEPGKNDSWAIYMAPLSTEECRKGWDYLSGRHSKVYEPVEDFIAYARKSFENQGKERVVGMFTYWGAQPAQWATRHQTPPTSEGRAEYWTANCERTTVCILLAKTSNNNDYSLIVFDPRTKYEHLR